MGVISLLWCRERAGRGGEILGVMRRLGRKCMSKEAGSLTTAVKKDDGGCCWEEVAS